MTTCMLTERAPGPRPTRTCTEISPSPPAAFPSESNHLVSLPFPPTRKMAHFGDLVHCPASGSCLYLAQVTHASILGTPDDEMENVMPIVDGIFFGSRAGDSMEDGEIPGSASSSPSLFSAVPARSESDPGSSSRRSASAPTGASMPVMYSTMGLSARVSRGPPRGPRRFLTRSQTKTSLKACALERADFIMLHPGPGKRSGQWIA